MVASPTALLLLWASSCSGLSTPPIRSAVRGACQGQAPLFGRRQAAVAGLATLVAPLAAQASGGATSGRTTSIPRAKLRYYDRITLAVTEFESLSATIGGPEQKKAGKVFFSDNDEAAFSELKSAGYLLAVAFKIDAKIPPDKLQTVKDWKKMIKSLENLKGAMAGKPDEAKKVYATAKASMDEWLVGVELPPTGDSRYVPQA